MYKQTDNAQVNNSLRELSKGLFYYLQTEKLEKAMPYLEKLYQETAIG